jgi:hypothetical protein
MNRYFVFVALLLAFPQSAHCSCLPRPSVEATVRVRSCTAISFGAGHEAYGNGDYLRSNANISGVVLRGKVMSSELKWRDPPPHREFGNSEWDPTPLQMGSLENFVLLGYKSTECPKLVNSKIQIITINRCCDLLPKNGSCAVPFPIYEIFTVNTKSYPVTGSKR